METEYKFCISLKYEINFICHFYPPFLLMHDKASKLQLILFRLLSIYHLLTNIEPNLYSVPINSALHYKSDIGNPGNPVNIIYINYAIKNINISYA